MLPLCIALYRDRKFISEPGGAIFVGFFKFFWRGVGLCAHEKVPNICFFLASAPQGEKFGVLYLDSHIILTEYGPKPYSDYCI